MKNVEQNKVVHNEQVIESIDSSQTQKHSAHKNFSTNTPDIQAMTLPTKKAQNVMKEEKKTLQKSSSFRSKRAQEEAQTLRIRCKQLCISTFFQSHTSMHSLGFTSAIAGEGKSFLARIAAETMAEDDGIPVTLMECNWEHPSLSNDFHLAQDLGLAEWLREDCTLTAVRHQVHSNLTVIPAGNSKNNAIGLLRALQQRGVLDVLSRSNEILIVDLPSVITTPYGHLAASLVDALIMVVRMGVTPESFVTEANSMLKDLPMQGIVFNQVKSQVPRWLRQIL